MKAMFSANFIKLKIFEVYVLIEKEKIHVVNAFMHIQISLVRHPRDHLKMIY